MWKYTKEHIDYIRSIADNRYNSEIAELFNQKFGMNKTASQINALKGNHKITSGNVRRRNRPDSRLFNDNQVDFIKDNAKGLSNLELAEKVNSKFGLDITAKQMNTWKKNNNVTSGINTCFVKGQATWNKGMKGLNTGGEEGWFKKGDKPYNYQPVGTERVNGEGYTDIKVADPGVWKTKHRIIWEEVNGEVPTGHVLIFGDGDKSNIVLENIILVSRSQLSVLNRFGLIQDDSELTRIGITIADLQMKINERK